LIPVAFDANGTVRDARGLRLEHVEVAAGERELHVQEADHSERAGKPPHDVTDLEVRRRIERRRRKRTSRVAGVHAGLLDVLHHGGDVAERSVGQRVDVDLNRVLEETIDEHAALEVAHRVAYLLARVADAHCASAEHI